MHLRVGAALCFAKRWLVYLGVGDAGLQAEALCCCLQEDMYSFVTYADDQATKGKGTAIVEA